MEWLKRSEILYEYLKKLLFLSVVIDTIYTFLFWIQVVKAQTEARILVEYHQLIEEGKEKFKKELESVVPEVKLGRKGKSNHNIVNKKN